MNEKQIAESMSAFHNNESLDWNNIVYEYKTVNKEQILQYIQDTIDELKGMLEGFKK